MKDLMEQIEMGIMWIETTPGSFNRIPLDRDHGLYLLRGAKDEVERLRHYIKQQEPDGLFWWESESLEDKPVSLLENLD